ncbi:NADH dehydrogenase [ubiquinone] 1 subunit C2-like [Tubulanus polymorphus]|uniref:NADH dehydrogenase [ubiquinone] 1 subunit C2-like n=1 Tax=Tubulanus polymorphus TaxID=672921 RepID=UPI003DA32A39
MDSIRSFRGPNERIGVVPYDLIIGAMGFGAVSLMNVIARKPVYTAFYKHILATGVGYGIGTVMNNQVDRWAKEKELVILDYISKHPEDFEEPPPKKYKDVFDTWHPIR